MQVRFPSSGKAAGGLRAMLGFAMLGLAACSNGGDLPAGPNLPGDPPSNNQFRQAAFVFDVNTVTKAVNITAAKATMDKPSAAKGAPNAFSAALAKRPNFSILGSDVISVSTDPASYSASGVGTGGASPGKVLVKFKVAITNNLDGVQLVKPTFPTPPSTTLDRIYMFPFETPVKTTTGGTTDSSNVVIVELPSRGEVQPSNDFNGDGATLTGNPFNFFNDAGCPDGANSTTNTKSDCFRYEAFAAPLGPLTTTSFQEIGFEIDPTVAQFRARMIIASDLASSGAAVTTTVSGLVTSNNGPVSGATVNVTGGFSGTTDASGNYTIAGVTPGPKTVSVSGMPTGCTVASQSVTASGSPLTVNFTATCPIAVGTVNGVVNFASGSLTPSLTSALVTITPSAAGTSPVTTNPVSASGGFSYSSASVQVGTGTGVGAGAVSIGSLPAGCTVQTPSSGYTGLTTTTAATAGPITLNCVAPPSQYQYNTSWSLSGTTATLTVRMDMTSRNDANVNGAAADDIGGFQANIAYPIARLTVNTCAAGAGPFDIGLVGRSTPGLLVPGLVATTGLTGNAVLFTCSFTVGAGAATSVATTTTGIVASPDGAGDTLPGSGSFNNADIQVTDGSLSLPAQ